jgi:hypothetical protein
MQKLSKLLTALTLCTAALTVRAADTLDLAEFANRFIQAENQAWQQAEFAALEAIEDPAIVFHGLGLNGFEAHRQYIIDARQTITGLQQDWTFLAGDGSLFALWYLATAAVSGQQIRTEALMLFRVENHRIKEVWMHASTTNPEAQPAPDRENR